MEGIRAEELAATEARVGGLRDTYLNTITGETVGRSFNIREGPWGPPGYHLVLLSDHGQSQGEPFAARYGTDLSDLCRSLTQSRTAGV